MLRGNELATEIAQTHLENAVRLISPPLLVCKSWPDGRTVQQTAVQYTCSPDIMSVTVSQSQYVTIQILSHEAVHL